MTPQVRPAVNTLVQIDVPGGGHFDSRVEDVTTGRISVAAPLRPLADQPGVGASVALRWAAGPRGRYAMPATIVATGRSGVPVWVVEAAGPTDIEQHRQYVRGGGGEALQLRPVTPHTDGRPAAVTHGHVVDVGECSVRGRFTGLQIAVGDRAWLQLSLGGTLVTTTGEVRQVVTEATGPVVEVVVLYDLVEGQARAVRQYVMRQQLLTRTRTAAE